MFTKEVNHMDHQPLLTSDSIAMLINSITAQGTKSITELEAERLLNAIARVQAGVPTGVSQQTEPENPQH